MKTGIWEIVRRHLPPDREIIVRTGDRMGYLRLPQWVQVGCIGALGLAIAWIALATHLNFNQLEIIAHRDARIVAAETARRDAQAALDVARREVALSGRRADVGRERAERLADANRALGVRIESLQQQLARGEASQVENAAKQATLNDEIARLQQRIDALQTERSRLADASVSLRDEVARREREKLMLAARVDRLLPTVDALKQERLDAEHTVATLREELARGEMEREQIVAERDRVATEREAIAERFAALSDELATLESAQEQIISRFDSQTVDSIELVEKTLALTGVDVERLLGRLEPAVDAGGEAGVGGPFIAALDDMGGNATAELASNIAAVEERVARWQGLQTLLARLPLAVPLDNFHVTSTFGRRMDPMTDRPAMHEGIDFSSERRAEVRTTSPGRVSFVGWRGGYGKMVEVDHGLGIRTRYAHLSKAYVKPGQEVDFRDKLGQVGNTGRSTGEHLHYEVLLDGRALDPANFMKAGQYVFKN